MDDEIVPDASSLTSLGRAGPGRAGPGAILRARYVPIPGTPAASRSGIL